MLLTPGPLNETYFEHAYLARYLGFTLVEGGDLTVRDRRVFIKTLDGLQPVDVIFRRLDDSYCDPLELRSDSTLGVAGLVEAARAGNVTIANALGSGVIETAAHLQIPAGALRAACLARTSCCHRCHTTGAASRTISSTSRASRSHGHQADVSAASTEQPIFGRVLSRCSVSRWSSEIREHPAHFVGQDEMPLSTAPVWQGQKLEPRRSCCACMWQRPATRTRSCLAG